MRIHLLALAALSVLTPARAVGSPPPSPQMRAELARPVPAPINIVLGPVAWRCGERACAGAPLDGRPLPPLVAGCQALAGAVGPLASYAARGRAIPTSSLAACNKAARGRGRSAPAAPAKGA